MAARRNLFFLIFMISGFSGIIYESIWNHYLKLFLGHAAYAQTLVLAIFMGGLSIGAWLSGRFSASRRNLFRGYALTEGTIGILALAFHPVFVSTLDFSYTTVIPGLGSTFAVNAYKLTVSALLILPQSILLGMTFPLMSAALLRAYPGTPGRSLAMLYFTNSIGAAVGVLVSGFFLVRVAGLPGTIVFAAVINICLAIAVWFLGPGERPELQPQLLSARGNRDHALLLWYRLLLFASLATGAASFIYEVGWIRMLSLVLGSSTHAFELMLSAFIFGLAFGGLWIRRRIDAFPDPVRVLVFVQITMGLLALATLPLYGNSFSLMQWLMLKLPKTEIGYAFFNVSSGFLALAVMLPATFCAGMTLPLITFVLLKQGAGDGSIGAVYAMNTIGAIIGVVFAIHAGMPLLGLKGLITAGSVLDMCLGVFLLWRLQPGPDKNVSTALAAGLCLSAAAAALFLVTLDPYKMSSGVYRKGALLDPGKDRIIFQKDGKTSTVSVVESMRSRSITTNGKTDAAINRSIPHRATVDETTMILTGVLPLAYNPGARTVANIGFGSGLTSHTLLYDLGITEMDTVEIEREMVEGARNFGAEVELVYRDPRSKIWIDDAKTFFSAHNKKYDIIISEPSNPWVSGVASLFSEEFYRLIVRHLNANAVFVQWVQLYEIDLNLVASIFKAIAPHFHDFDIYTVNYGDLIIVAKKDSALNGIDPSLFENARIAAALRRVNIKGPEDIETRRIGNKKMWMPFFSGVPVPANSDYYPVLDQNAARTRFLEKSAQEMVRLGREPLPLVEMLSSSGLQASDATNVTLSPFYPKTLIVNTAAALRDYLLHGSFPANHDEDWETRIHAEQARNIFFECEPKADGNRRIALFNTLKNSIPYLSPSESAAVWKKLEAGQCAGRLSLLEKSYISLFKAIGRRDGKSMAEAAKFLLEHEKDITPARLKYVVAAGMLGNLAEGNLQGSEAFWRMFQTRVNGEEQNIFLLRFLETETFAAAAQGGKEQK